MGLVALVCAILLVILIPNEVWYALLYLALVAVVGIVGFGAFLIWITTLA